MSTRSKRWLATSAVAILALAVCSGVLLWHKRGQITTPLPPNDVAKWKLLSEQTSAWLHDGQYEQIRKVDSLVLTDQYSAPAAGYFATLAVNCAKARRLGKYGDPYAHLIAAEEALSNWPESDPQLLYELASEHSLIRCYHRAFKLLERIPVAQRDDTTLRLRKRLLQTLSILRTTTDSLGTPKTISSEEDTINRELSDLLGVVPQNIFYSEDSLLDTNLSEEADLLPANAAKLKNSSALAVATLHRPKMLPPLPLTALDARFAAENGNQPPAGAAPALETAADESLEDVPLSLHARELGFQLLHSPSFSDSNLPAAKSNPFLAELLKANRANLKPPDLTRIFRSKDALALEFSGDEIRVFFVSGKNASTLKASAWTSSEDAGDFEIQDVTGDGLPEIITTERNGSGSYLSATIFDPSHNKTVFEANDLAHGDLRMIDIDNDPALEIVALERAEFQRSSCNQCPGRFLVTVYDYDNKVQKYEPVWRRLTYSELQLNEARNSFGVYAYMSHGRDQSKIREVLKTLRGQPTNAWTDESGKQLLAGFDRLTELEGSQELINLQREVIATLDRRDLPEKWLEVRRGMQLRNIENRIYRRELNEASALAAENWLLEGAPKSFLANFHNTMGVLNQLQGRMSAAFDFFNTAMNESAGLAPSEVSKIEGNLAMYFRTLGDTSSAYTFAQRALDHAGLVENGPTPSQTNDGTAARLSGIQGLDMMHLAELALARRKDAEALDWASRAIRVGNADPESAVTVQALQVAAEVALLHDKASLAIELLDEAISESRELSWKTAGGNVLLLYGKALAQEGKQSDAIPLLEASAKLSKDVNTTVQCLALYELSQIFKRSNRMAEALDYARQAFEAVCVQRKAVKLEEQKFSFLADKATIASWFFQLLIESNSDPSELLYNVESWKMRSFLDLHDSDTSQMLSSAKELSEQLTGLLGDDDLFLDYVALGKTAFVIAVSKHEIKVHPHLNSSEIVQLKTQALDGFDIRKATTLSDVRKDVLPAELGKSLQELYQKTLGEFGLPGSAKRLIIAPDEVLFGIPWPALKTKDGNYLIDHVELMLVPSAMVGISISKSASSKPPPNTSRILIACALGGVRASELAASERYPNSRVQFSDLAPLNDGLTECKAVANVLRGYDVDMVADRGTLRSLGLDERKLATPGRLKELAPGARIIHIVSHGMFEPAYPMQSRLFLDSDNSGRVLTAAEISLLDLHSADLVTLAACQTGQYAAMVGSEPLGFLRALLGAGAASALLSNWEVDDNATVKLQSEFYGRLGNSRKSAALRDAQLVVRAKYRHPYFWAAQTLYGYWN